MGASADAPDADACGAAAEPQEMPAASAAAEAAAQLRLQELVRLAEQQAQQLELEGHTRADLEDVLQRIERHFRGEQAVRREAEEAERDASSELVHERELRVRLEEELRVRSAETKQTDVLLASLAAEHAAVEDECKRAEQELAVARSEAKKALATLAKTEEGVRQTEAMELLKLEAEHNTRMNSLYAELEGVREELDIRTRVIGAEMVRWRAQAEAAAAAVRDAKDELMDRKRELDVTKERMDGLVEKLYVGREKGLELRGAIDSHLERFRQQHTAQVQAVAEPAPAAPVAHVAAAPAASESIAAPAASKSIAAPAAASESIAAPAVVEAATPPVDAPPVDAPHKPAPHKPAAVTPPAAAARGYADLSRAVKSRNEKPRAAG